MTSFRTFYQGILNCKEYLYIFLQYTVLSCKKYIRSMNIYDDRDVK